MEIRVLLSLIAAIGILGFGIWGQLRSIKKDPRFWYPAISELYERTGFEAWFIRSHPAEKLRLLKPWESERNSAREYVCKIGTMILNGVLFVLGVTLLVEISVGNAQKQSVIYQTKDGLYLARGEPGSEQVSLNLKGQLTDVDGNTKEQQFELIIPNRIAEEEEAERLFQAAEMELDAVWLNGNVSADEVRSDLNLIRDIPGTSITVSWDTGGSFLVSENGRIWNEDVSEAGAEVVLTATLLLDGWEKTLSRTIRILPAQKGAGNNWEQHLEEYLMSEAERTPDGDALRLPEELNGYPISWKTEGEPQIPLLLLLFVLAAAIAAIGHEKLSEGLKKRAAQLTADYPEIVSKLSLFLGAGMSMRMAWGRIVGEYTQALAEGGERRFAYEEMRITWNELRVGTAEEDAFERFGRNVGDIAYIRFGTLLAQNVRKGGAQLTAMLEAEEAEAFAGRRERAKQQGEKAGTKLLGPMIGMLVIVIVIVMLPAFWSM